LENKNQSNLSFWLFSYGLVYPIFHILPAFLNFEIKHRFMVADLFDLFTPFVVIFFVYKIYQNLNLLYFEKKSPLLVKIILIIGAIIFIEGHGIHLSANAIHRHLNPNENRSLYALTYFFDETIGHIMWDSGIIILSLGLIFSSQKKDIEEKSLIFGLILIGAMFYGFTYFVNAVEGQTVIFTFPFSILIVLVIWLLNQNKKISIFKNSVVFFYLVSYLVANFLFLIWLIWQKGFPEFSELGWI